MGTALFADRMRPGREWSLGWGWSLVKEREERDKRAKRDKRAQAFRLSRVSRLFHIPNGGSSADGP